MIAARPNAGLPLPNNAIRLVDGPNERVGRLEVFYDHEWGTVHSAGFTDAAARVACYALGFG